MSYLPGIHIIASLEVPTTDLISTSGGFREKLHSLITLHGLKNLGDVYHDFKPFGFTAVACLSESHISVHTWPEHRLVNLDIYLSNFERNNDGTVQQLFDEVVRYFDARITHQQNIIR